MTIRNVPETVGPISPVAWWSEELSLLDRPAQPLDPDREHERRAAKTIVEWPREKKKPTLSGRWPSVISLRVVLSIAPMWSASKAWRRPSV